MSLRDDLDRITRWRGEQPAPQPYSAEHKARIEDILPEVQRDPTYAACEIVKLEGELATVLSKLDALTKALETSRLETQCAEKGWPETRRLIEENESLARRLDCAKKLLLSSLGGEGSVKDADQWNAELRALFPEEFKAGVVETQCPNCRPEGPHAPDCTLGGHESIERAALVSEKQEP